MLLGHTDKAKIFKHLIEAKRLAHGYLFFGESHVGKCTFAKCLANFLETGRFEEPTLPLLETLIVQPEADTIGIDAIRHARQFLSRKPLRSTRRVLIVDNAEKLTNQAQNAILKLAEEPPPSSLIIMVVSSPEVLLPTLQSRLQKIYFPRIKTEAIEKILVSNFGLEPLKANTLARESLGKPGLAIDSINDEKDKTVAVLVRELFSGHSKRATIEEVLGGEGLTERFLTKVIAKLSTDPIKHYKTLSKIMDRLVKMADFTTNKRLQLEAALWNI
jgi:DNA polymerase-3 subunit delta'